MKQLFKAEGKDKEQLTLRLEAIQQQLAAAQKKLYGTSSERRPGDEGEAEAKAKAAP
jgi:hypothetical protein